MIFLFDFTLFVIDIHHIVLISLFPTPFDHFHFHPTLGLDPALILTLRLKKEYTVKMVASVGLNFLHKRKIIPYIKISYLKMEAYIEIHPLAFM